MTPEENKGFNLGYAAGSDSTAADWWIALSEYLDLDVDGPMDAVGKLKAWREEAVVRQLDVMALEFEQRDQNGSLLWAAQKIREVIAIRRASAEKAEG